MLANPEQVVYQSPLFSVLEYHCHGEDTAGSAEEAAVRYQMSFPRAGMYVKHDARGQQVMDANQVVFYEQDRPYQIVHPIKPDGRLNHFCDVCTIFEIEREAVVDMRRQLGESDGDKGWLFPRGSISITLPDKAYVQILVKALLAAPTIEAIVYEEQVLDFLTRILAASMEETSSAAACCRTRRSQAAHTELVEEVKLVVGRRFRENLSLDQIAEAVFHSPYSLARIFKWHTGMSIHQYLVNLRLLHGLEELLAAPQEPVGQIGVDLGFATPSHFTTSFLGAFNATPSAFREKASPQRLLELRNILKVG